MGLDLDKWIALIKTGEKFLPEHDLKTLCRYVCDILVEENNVQVVQPPVIICGDIHGQFLDLLELFRTAERVFEEARYVFMGDFVDRGMNSLETLTYLLLLKARYPDRMTLLRGNHESRQVTAIYGFWDECQKKYGGSDAWRCCTDVFDYLPIAALVDNKIFCVHGGLSPQIRAIDQIRLIRRLQEVPNDGMFCDLVWSDPDESVNMWSVSPRGAGWLFGAAATEVFMHINNLDLITRAHQLVQEGHKYHFKDKKNANGESPKLVTVWSAPNYCYRCGNLASILAVDENLHGKFHTFKEVSPQYIHQGVSCPSYFL